MPKDNFSDLAQLYAQFRPNYPPELYQHLLSFCPTCHRLWDVGTGNGQVPSQLAAFFQEVYATDISAAQLQQAPQLPNTHYVVAPAEHTDFPDHYFDLITVAQAIHWFDFAAFFQEVQRVAAPQAILAFWGYGLLSVEPELDGYIQHFYTQVVGPYWDAERDHIDAAYVSIPCPFVEIKDQPSFYLHHPCTFEQLEDYLNTWSSVKHMTKATGSNPVPAFMAQIRELWPVGAIKTMTFRFFLRMFRVNELKGI